MLVLQTTGRRAKLMTIWALRVCHQRTYGDFDPADIHTVLGSAEVKLKVMQLRGVKHISVETLTQEHQGPWASDRFWSVHFTPQEAVFELQGDFGRNVPNDSNVILLCLGSRVFYVDCIPTPLIQPLPFSRFYD